MKAVRSGRLILCLVFLTLLATQQATLAADPTGLEGTTNTAVDYVWILVCALLLMFMQAGFAMLEAGFCRAKNATNLMGKNLMDFVIGSITFFLVGYAIMRGGDWHGLWGTQGWLMLGSYYDVDKYLSMFWMLVFCATAATIVAGAVAERPKFRTYLVYSVIFSAIIYPVYGHWVWGGQWLSQLPFGAGAVDFAGSGVGSCHRGFCRLSGDNRCWSAIW